jgi:hypothetical protein
LDESADAEPSESAALLGFYVLCMRRWRVRAFGLRRHTRSVGLSLASTRSSSMVKGSSPSRVCRVPKVLEDRTEIKRAYSIQRIGDPSGTPVTWYGGGRLSCGCHLLAAFMMKFLIEGAFTSA